MIYNANMSKTILRKKQFFLTLLPARLYRYAVEVQFTGNSRPFMLRFVPLVGKDFTIL
jgi:hypothetical protein